MLILSEQQVQELAVADEVIAALREAFARDFSSTLRMPIRSSMDLHGAVLLLMPAYDSRLGVAGVKTVTVSRAGVNAVYELLNAESGEVLAVMEANHLTAVRTAAASALVTDLLARRDAETLGVFGTGRQAEAHFAVLPRVRRFKRFLVCGRRGLPEFCRRMKQQNGVDVQAVDAATCARESDVLCTCTTAHEPLFDGALLKSGTHLNLVGGFQPDKREVDDETVRRSRVVVDTREGALAEAGELLIPMRSGAIAREHILADLHELASGKKQVRRSPEEVTLFKSVGCALEDLVTAHLIYRKAMA